MDLDGKCGVLCGKRDPGISFVKTAPGANVISNKQTNKLKMASHSVKGYSYSQWRKSRLPWLPSIQVVLGPAILHLPQLSHGKARKYSGWLLLGPPWSHWLTDSQLAEVFLDTVTD